MGSHMIWVITFKDKFSKESFESMMDNKCIQHNIIHDHYEEDDLFENCEFFYDMGYLGYMEAEELKPKLKKSGVIELRQICLCNTDGEEIIRLR